LSQEQRTRNVTLPVRDNSAVDIRRHASIVVIANAPETDKTITQWRDAEGGFSKIQYLVFARKKPKSASDQYKAFSIQPRNILARPIFSKTKIKMSYGRRNLIW
jgi:hypothetical protein